MLFNGKICRCQMDDAMKNAVQDLLKAVIEELEEQYANEGEAFENYSKRVHLKLYKDMKGFSERFLKGYDVIMEEINK